MGWLKHAFAVDPPGAAEPDETQRRVVEWFCREVVRRHLTTPAITFLEMFRPMNYLGAQALHFMAPVVEPIAQLFVDRRDWQTFVMYLERRGAVEWIARRIETLEADATAAERRRREPSNPDSDEPRHDEND